MVQNQGQYQFTKGATAFTQRRFTNNFFNAGAPPKSEFTSVFNDKAQLQTDFAISPSDDSNKQFCFFKFTKHCSPVDTEPLIIGGLCNKHNKKFTHRVFLPIMMDGRNILCPVSTTESLLTKKWFVISLQPGYKNAEYFQRIMNTYCQVSPEDSLAVSEFLTYLTNPNQVSMRNVDFLDFETYLNTYIICCHKVLQHNEPVWSKTLIAVEFTDAYAALVAHNSFYVYIKKLATDGDGDYKIPSMVVKGLSIYFVPLTLFPVFDRLQIASYLLWPAPNIASAVIDSNCLIRDGRFMHGFNGGIVNRHLEEKLIVRNKQPYSKDVLAVINKIPCEVNHDVLVLESVADQNCPMPPVNLPLAVTCEISASSLTTHDLPPSIHFDQMMQMPTSLNSR